VPTTVTGSVLCLRRKGKMEEETTYRKIAETRYTLTEDEIFVALVEQFEIDIGYDHEFCIRDLGHEYCAQIVTKRTVAVDDSGPVMTAT
jgi:hypothetical protein